MKAIMLRLNSGLARALMAGLMVFLVLAAFPGFVPGFADEPKPPIA